MGLAAEATRIRFAYTYDPQFKLLSALLGLTDHLTQETSDHHMDSK